jgi:hypothetical protein
MSRSLTRQIAREARQKKRSEIIERDFKDIKAKFPEAVKAFITFGGNLSQRMKEEAQRFNDGLPRSQVRQILSDRKAAVERSNRRIAFEKERQVIEAKKESKVSAASVLSIAMAAMGTSIFRRGVK